MLAGPIVRQRKPASVAESSGVESCAMTGDALASSAPATSASGADLRMSWESGWREGRRGPGREQKQYAAAPGCVGHSGRPGRACDAKLRPGGQLMEGRVRCSTMRTMMLAGAATIAVAAYTPRVMAQGAALKGATAVSATVR